jgi:DNA-damage-inducible protein D
MDNDKELDKLPAIPSFEDFANENGIKWWWASFMAEMLGYKDLNSFEKAIGRAIKACISLNIPHHENFIPIAREINGQNLTDYKLTRFACYLTVMNADPKKHGVAAAQVYFAEQTRRFELLIQDPEQIERILIRDDVKDGNKSLMSSAKKAGLKDYALFHNAGYRGMYNMLNVELAKRRGIDSKELWNYMGRTELAANLFRITQTEEKIKSHGIKGQIELERTHCEVGREVRNIVKANTGKSPEDLPMDQRLPELQKEIKKGYRKMLKADKQKKKPSSNKPISKT